MYNNKYNFSDSSLFGEESEIEVLSFIFKGIGNPREPAIVSAVNKLYNYSLEEGDEATCRFLERDFGYYLYGNIKENKIRQAKIKLAWSVWKLDLIKSGRWEEAKDLFP